MNKKSATFEQAINASAMWCKSWESGELSDEVIADRISELLITSNGSRGFFVVCLASDCLLFDRLPDAVLIKLREAGEKVVDLLARNLAMSAAMRIEHIRNSNYELQVSSERVSSRCRDILRLLDPNIVKDALESLLDSINGEGAYLEFLKKWKYDKEQKSAIALVISSVAENN